MEMKWWKEGIVYQIYPRSYKDTTGNGIGDLNGIIQKLDYIQSLGVDIIWLNPIYASPNDDNGYDISDYRVIMPEFGTMNDFERLLEGLHERGLKLIMDLVVNHSSDEHEWFQQSRSSRNNEYRNYYHWWPAEKGIPPTRWSYFDIESNAWTYDTQTDSYYLHYFSKKQPDLNWENPKLRHEIYDMMRFWFDKGVDGFRMDVISFISKNIDFPVLPKGSVPEDFIEFYAHGPRLHEYLNEMNREVLSHYDVMTVGEAPGITLEDALDIVDEERKELDMFFHFDLMTLDREEGEVFKMNPDGWSLSQFKNIFGEWDATFAEKGWGSIFLGNHDFPRMVSRWGNDRKSHWYHSSTMLHTFLMTMRGTPYVYYGDEIGMTNIRFETIGQYKDINTINKYRQLENQGEDLNSFLADQKEASRDNARTPMQWDQTSNAGFSKSSPWIEINKNYLSGVSVAFQEESENSVLNFFRKIVAIRKKNLALVYGQYQEVDVENENVYAYLRKGVNVTFLILLNFCDKNSFIKLPRHFETLNWELVISNDVVNRDEMLPYQCIVYKTFT